MNVARNEKRRLVIIDGKSVFYRGYYAMPNLSTKDGTPTGGVFGFATMALEVIKRLERDIDRRFPLKTRNGESFRHAGR